MTAVYVILLLSPFAAGLAIAFSERAKSWIGRHSLACTVAGFVALVLAIAAAAALDGSPRIAALAVLCPLMALSFWRRPHGPGGDGGGGGGGGGGDDPGPLPRPPEIDWDRFMQELDEYTGARR